MTTSAYPDIADMTDRQSLDDPGLRRADWRFLMPQAPGGIFEHLVVLGGPPALAGRIEQLGLAQRVSGVLPAAEQIDALVILHDAEIQLRTAIGYLKPGGVLYMEVDRRSARRRAMTPARARQRLRAAGMSPIGTYWVTPDFATSQRFLPLDAKGALAWYIANHYTASSLKRRLAEDGLQAMLMLNQRIFAALIGCYAIVAIAGPIKYAPPAALSDPALPRQLRWPGVWPLLLTGGSDDIHRMILLPFTSQSRQPIAVLKMARLPEFNRDTIGEQALLARMRSTLTPAMAQSIPQALGLFRHDELVVGLESYRPGRSLSALVGRWGLPQSQKIDQLNCVTTWLIQFHQQAQISRRPWDAAEIERWVAQPLAAYTRLIGATAAETQLFGRLRSHAEQLVGAPLPIIWQHHNFGEWNILRASRAINVIDWEHARAGLPLYDLLHFVLQWSYSVLRLSSEVDQLAAFRELFCGTAVGNQVVRATRGAVARYMRLLGIDERFLPLLLIYAWMEKAITYAEAQREYRPAALDFRAGNRSVAYIGILAEQIEQLFTESNLRLQCAS